MSLFDEIKAEPVGRQEQCSLTQWLKTQAPQDQRDVLAAIHDKSIAGTQIGRVIMRRGFMSSTSRGADQVVRRHRIDPCKTCEALKSGDA